LVGLEIERANLLELDQGLAGELQEVGLLGALFRVGKVAGPAVERVLDGAALRGDPDAPAVAVIGIARDPGDAGDLAVGIDGEGLGTVASDIALGVVAVGPGLGPADAGELVRRVVAVGQRPRAGSGAQVVQRVVGITNAAPEPDCTVQPVQIVVAERRVVGAVALVVEHLEIAGVAVAIDIALQDRRAELGLLDPRPELSVERAGERQGGGATQRVA
jgi:hypothetical protein